MTERLSAFLLLVASAIASASAGAHAPDAPNELVVHGSYRLHQTTPIATRIDGGTVEVIDSEISIRPDRASASFSEISGRCVLVRPLAMATSSLRTCVLSDAAGDRLVSETRIEAPSVDGLASAYGVRRSTFTSGTGKFREVRGELSAYPVSLRALNSRGELEGSGRFEIRLQRRAGGQGNMIEALQ
jgi:hypothetical protein